jgi:hypothetical protein
MVFIVGKALVNLRSGQLWEAVCRQCVNRFAILKQANDVVEIIPAWYGSLGTVSTAEAREAWRLNIYKSVLEIHPLWAGEPVLGRNSSFQTTVPIC